MIFANTFIEFKLLPISFEWETTAALVTLPPYLVKIAAQPGARAHAYVAGVDDQVVSLVVPGHPGTWNLPLAAVADVVEMIPAEGTDESGGVWRVATPPSNAHIRIVARGGGLEVESLSIFGAGLTDTMFKSFTTNP